MKDFNPPDRLIELIDVLQNDGQLGDAESAEFEALLAADDEARQYYILSQELHTMLGVDKTIRLQLAADLLPENVIPLPGVDLSRVSIPEEVPRRGLPPGNHSRSALRVATSLAALIAAVFVLLWMYARVSDFSMIALQNRSDLDIAGHRDKISFRNEVLPILTDHCFECHGEDEENRKADLRLDIARAALGGDEPVIIPGEPEKSELVARIGSSDPEFVMPPPEADKKLSAAEIALLTAWIAQGADYESDWSMRRESDIQCLLALLRR